MVHKLLAVYRRIAFVHLHTILEGKTATTVAFEFLALAILLYSVSGIPFFNLLKSVLSWYGSGMGEGIGCKQLHVLRSPTRTLDQSYPFG